MKKFTILSSLGLTIIILGLSSFILSETYKPATPKTENGCVFRTVFSEESDTVARYATHEKVITSMDKGLIWISQAQQKDGGWGAGSHSNQKLLDPHAVHTDPATTAMVAMALLRSGNTFDQGEYSRNLNKALQYLIQAVETSTANNPNITNERGTQIQRKLGDNIDVILTAQFFANALEYLNEGNSKSKVQECLNRCIMKIEKTQDVDGSFKGAGWAGVLQSSMANNALESAQKQGATVKREVLEKSRAYQKGNYDTTTRKVNTEKGAGIVLYTISGSTRASAKEARKAKIEIEKAKQEGKLKENQDVSTENLEKLGYSKTDAMKYSTSYNVFKSAKEVAQEDGVLSGFGNNGGEEFLSFLQTGESLIIGKDTSWKDWYHKTSGRLLAIQEKDGSWKGHHCITSPVFCTATCLLILSVNNDIARLEKLGDE